MKLKLLTIVLMASAVACGGEFGDENSLTDTQQTDSDNDGLTDAEEEEAGTDPHDADSDDDGLLDGEEKDHGSDPLDDDSDDDGHKDGDDIAPNDEAFHKPADFETSFCSEAAEACEATDSYESEDCQFFKHECLPSHEEGDDKPKEEQPDYDSDCDYFAHHCEEGNEDKCEIYNRECVEHPEEGPGEEEGGEDCECVNYAADSDTCEEFECAGDDENAGGEEEPWTCEDFAHACEADNGEACEVYELECID